jgi:DNA uptake protein ComE-like DNA-binding protein
MQGESATPSPPPSRFQIWTRRQRLVLASLVLVFCAYLLTRATFHPQSVSDPPPASGPLAPTLATRVDPNTADWPAFAALPLIGEKRAKEIIAWRDQFLLDHPDETPFEKIEDLTRIKGIGKVTAERLEPYLIFPQPDQSTPAR